MFVIVVEFYYLLADALKYVLGAVEFGIASRVESFSQIDLANLK